MRVAVFRAAADAARTAERLAAAGHEAVLAPVIQIVPTGQPLPRVAPDAVIFTSAHGVEAIATDAALPNLLALPAYCVGSRTESCALDLGFRTVRGARANAETLAALIASEIRPGASLLLIAGRDRKAGLEQRLNAGSYALSIAEVYEAQSASPWSEAVARSLAGDDVVAALHYSRRSAELALEQVRICGSLNSFLRLRHVCLSDDTAIPLRAAGARETVIADAPEETALLSRLQQSVSGPG